MASLQRLEARQDLVLFLRERRSRTKPQDVGLAPGMRRRTPGLRREEVAQLVGVSATWYTWFEQGRDIQVSTQFLERLGVAFRLDAGDRAMLFKLAQHHPPTAHSPTVPTLVAPQEQASAGNPTRLAVSGSRQALVAVRSASELETYRIPDQRGGGSSVFPACVSQ